ncbi:hypothetical protein BV25DRAFT_1918939 [Artomyces pyxidatus]|uniref:Uncharacterized protein n=1 Tax=Artomyces pyxidatus TaxID=48021 RepID=A0ACB8SR30_9AGAM|nr:hypothetical protein BV25DRAFT_1918939 [Artomyces pyxidatus]
MTDSILAVLGAGGWRGHDPMLHLFRLDTETPRNPTRFIANAFEVKVGLSDIARAMDVDAEDSVLYVGDEDRIKSYRCTMGAGDDDDGSALPVRTLDSLGFGGPLVVRDGGVRVLRAGNKGLAIWNTEELPTHGPDGRNRIGQRLSFDIFDTKRDKDGAGIERSIGSEPTQRVETTDFKNAKLWTQHPNDPNQMLVSFEEQYRLSAVDLATQKTAARYLGHGGYIGDIRTNAEDPHVFVTACYDGAVRLYDERLPTPVLTVFHASEWIMTALYEHIGGHPFLIIGGSNTQQVKVWDVRAKAALYELSTGNNDVDVLAWDARRQTLYAATQCQYVDSNGSVGYRRGKFPNTGRPWSEQDGGEDLGDDEDDEDWEDEEENASGYRACNWPDRAFHLEESFGHPLDSATHRLYRYRFKSDANPEVVPKSGYSRVGRSSY